MKLLERDSDLDRLAAMLATAAGGQGRLALVGGEAGIGKTSFIDRFLAVHGNSRRILIGHCDALFTPSPLGPLYDIARATGGRLLAQLEAEAPRPALFSTMLELLRDPAKPTLLVIEDIHWADEATFDLIKYVGRRIGQTRSLMVLTYRDDEVDDRPPLRTLLGDLLTLPSTARIDLQRLSRDAVRCMSDGQPLDPDALHRQTSGNPFFVTEILAYANQGIPKTLSDCVLARAARLDPAALACLETLAVLGSRIDQAALETVIDGEARSIADCRKAGLIMTNNDGVSFRHELMRVAILASLDPSRKREISRQALAGLRRTDNRNRLAQLAELAESAGDHAAVMDYGHAAARAAASVGAHREAASHYRRVLAFADDRPPAERAALCEALADQCAIIDAQPEAIAAHEAAIVLWRQAGNTMKEGLTLSKLAWPLVRNGRNDDAEAASSRAIELLETLPAGRELAEAYRMRSHLRMLDRDTSAAVDWGNKAIALAAQCGDDSTVAAAELVVGAAMLVSGDDSGLPHFDRCLDLARLGGRDDLVGLVYLNIGSSYGERYQFAKAEAALTEGVAYAEDHDLDHSNNYMWSWLALTRLYQGRWSEAADKAIAVINCPNFSLVAQIMALAALGRVRVRRGDPGVAGVLDQALEFAGRTNTLQRLAPVRAARAEAAWFAGDLDRVIVEASAVYDLALRRRHPWHVGELSFWLMRAGKKVTLPEYCAAPFALQIEGKWRAAAELWRSLDCPFEEARALAVGDEPAKLRALEIFDRLGAAPAATMLRQSLRQDGSRNIPRGPRAATLRNPFGLTTREMGILNCLAGGLSNGEIGSRLHISPKTVDHHVSAILAKLSVRSRGEAAALAMTQGLAPQNRETAAAK